MRAKQVETVIIGGGLLGCATAYYLARAGGGTVLIIERGRIGGEASTATAGGLGVQNKPPVLVPTMLVSLRLWDTLGEELDADVGYRRIGGLNIAGDDADLAHLETTMARQRAAGAEIGRLSPAESCRVEPGLSPAISGAAFCPDDSLATPALAVGAYADAARRLGVEIWPGTSVDRLSGTASHFLLETARGRIVAARLVNVAGAWANTIAGMLGSTLPIVPIVGQRLIVDASGISVRHLINHVRDTLSLKQHREDAIMIGGGWLGTGDLATGRKQTIEENVAANLALAAQILPRLATADPPRVTLGWDAATPDRLPLCGPWPGIANGFVVHGSRRGYSLGPYLGLAAAGIIAGDRPPDGAAAFSLLRASLTGDQGEPVHRERPPGRIEQLAEASNSRTGAAVDAPAVAG